MSHSARRALVFAVALLAGSQLGPACSNGGKHEPVGRQTFTSPQSRPIALHPNGAQLYVANTTSNTVTVVDTGDHSVVAEIAVGVEPVGLAVKPGGLELWVSNHVSDSVSVIDLNFFSETYLEVIETIQELDADGATLFDEPVGIAFASSAKAYVALSSRNEIAVVDAATHTVTGHIAITAQEPRSLTVQGGKLYVAAFESHNQSELSLCPSGGSPPQCTLDVDQLVDFLLTSPNLPGADPRIVVDPDLPDRDLFVIDVATDTVDESVEGLGTLLYEVVVDGAGEVFVTQTDARNHVNGGDARTGTQNLIELGNRMFLNQIGRVSCGGGCGGPTIWELEPLPPANPAPGDELATPYGLAISNDGSTLVATAAGTSRLFTVDATTGVVLDVLDLNDGVAADFGQQIPKGVALASDGSGAPETAYVLNTLENTVSVVDVSSPAAVVHVAKIPVGSDPTPPAVRRGRIAFNNAFASTTGTFSCESCHPDSNTDQLLWRIGGACFFGDCSGHDEPRSTMPIRGLKNTLPLHWDGTLGDPFGGSNGSVGVGGSGGSDCTLGDADGDHDCFVDLVEGSLSGVMCDQSGACPPGGNELSAAERDDMATFLADVSYPPARSRRLDDVASSAALQGFADFFLDQGGFGDLGGVSTCADMDSGCHALPLGADTNSALVGAFDAPTMRGMTDRWIHFSIGMTNPEEFLEWVKLPRTITIPGLGSVSTPATTLPYDPAQGLDEHVVFAAAMIFFDPFYGMSTTAMFQMFEEASTGHSGALGRQITLNATTATAPELTDTETLLDALETADLRGLVNLRADGVRRVSGTMQPVVLSFRSDGRYKNGNDQVSFTRAQVLALAAAGDAVLNVTAALPRNFGAYRAPLLSTATLGAGPTGNPDLPVLPGDDPMGLRGVDVREDAQILVDGVPVAGTLSCVGGFSPYCGSELLTVDLASMPANGLHLLQVQNPKGPASNELPICMGPVGGCTSP